MEARQKTLLLHDDAEAQALIERIKQKLAEQNGRKPSESDKSVGPTPRFLFSKNLC